MALASASHAARLKLGQHGRQLASCVAPPLQHVVIAGAGLAGASTAMHLTRHGARVTLIDPRPPLTATSQYSTECYRNFFIDQALVPFMSRSVDLMEELAGEENPFNLNRRGYCFLSSTNSGAEAFEHFANTASNFGAGPVRKHRDPKATYTMSPASGYRHEGMDGFDLVYGSSQIRDIFPFVSPEATVMLHARRCGWMDAQGLGRVMLNVAKEGQRDGPGSATVMQGSVGSFDKLDGHIKRVHVLKPDGSQASLDCDAFVNAAGAWMPAVNAMFAPENPLPLENEVHAKVILNDTFGVIPQNTAPFMVWRDRVTLDWGDFSKEDLMELDDTHDGGIVNASAWLEPQPGGQHFRPAGNGRVLLLWEHLHRHIALPENPAMPVAQFLPMYPQLCLQGLRVMVPGLEVYDARMGKDTTVDGGYYSVTPDARPVIGKHGAENAFVCGGMGTYGLMGSPAAGELAALHVLGLELPSYASACSWPRGDVLVEKPIDLLDDSA